MRQINKASMRNALAVGLFAFAGASEAQEARKPGAPQVSAAASKAAEAKAPAEGPTVETYYTAAKLRDPFMKTAAVSAATSAKAPEEKALAVAEFSIHNLSLRALMKDSTVDYAFLDDPAAGLSYILRRGKLFDLKGKVVPGVSGTMNIKKKLVTLSTPDQDVQVFQLGEEKDKDKIEDSGKPAEPKAPVKAGG